MKKIFLGIVALLAFVLVAGSVSAADNALCCECEVILTGENSWHNVALGQITPEDACQNYCNGIGQTWVSPQYYYICENLPGGQCGEPCTNAAGDCSCCAPAWYENGCNQITGNCGQGGNCMDGTRPNHGYTSTMLSCTCQGAVSTSTSSTSTTTDIGAIPEFSTYGLLIAVLAILGVYFFVIKKKK